MDSTHLLRGAKRAQDLLRRAKYHFVDQVNELCEIPEVQHRLSEGKLQVDGLFYVAESGTFLLYDITNHTFRPLLGKPIATKRQVTMSQILRLVSPT